MKERPAWPLTENIKISSLIEETAPQNSIFTLVQITAEGMSCYVVGTR